MVYLNEKSKKSIEKSTGLTVDQISHMCTEDVDAAIEKKIGKKLEFKVNNDPRLIGRGSVYIFLDRLLGSWRKK